MKIFGHPWIESEKFYPVTSIKQINNTPPNTTLLLNPLPKALKLAHYCKANQLPYALKINNIKEAIFANLLNANYLIADKELATQLMPIAQNYLFDTQVLAIIESESEIETMALAGVDGVILPPSLSQD